MKNYDGEKSIVDVGGINITDGGDALNILNLAAEMNLRVEEENVRLSALICNNGICQESQQLISNLKLSEEDVDRLLDQNIANVRNIGELLSKLFPHDLNLTTMLRTRLTAYEGIPVDQQCLHHNLETLRSLLKGGLAPVHDQSTNHSVLVKYIAGGNANLPMAIAEKLAGRIKLNKPLTKLSATDNNDILLTFADGTSATHDKIILAIPVSTYSDITVDGNVIPESTIANIQKIGVGLNHKVFVPFSRAHDVKHRTIITEKQISFFSYDNKILVLYCTSNMVDVSSELQTIQAAYGSDFLNISQISTIPDENYAVCDGVLEYVWPNHPYSKCSYSGYSVEIAEKFDEQIFIKGVPVKKIFAPIDERVYFIGEHATVLDEIGTMEAAVESAERIANFF